MNLAGVGYLAERVVYALPDMAPVGDCSSLTWVPILFKMRKYKMKKLVLFLLISVVTVDSGYAFIFGGAAWRRHYRRHRRGALYSAEKVVGPPSLQSVRDAVDAQLNK